MSRFCTACGTRNNDRAGFCEECGKPLRAAGADASVAQSHAAVPPEEPAARPASPTQRRSGLLPAVLASVFLIAAASGYAWWPSSRATNAGADASALKGAPAPSVPAPSATGHGSAVTVAAPGQAQPDVAQVTTRARNSETTDADRGGIVAAVKNLVSGADRETLEGTYVDSLGLSRYQFKNDGTVLWTNKMAGTPLEWKYERDGNTIKVLMPYGGYMVLKLRSNGSLQGPGLMGALTRQQSASSGGGNGGGNGASGGRGALAARLSKPEAEAMDLVLAEVASHYVKTSDGWTTAVSETLNAFTPTDHFLRQFREITPDGVDADEVGAADRLNGFEWAGAISFKTTPAREAGDPGLAFIHDLQPLAVGVFVYRAKGGGWTRWVDLQPRSMRVVKLNGVWKVPKGSSLLSGQPPTPEDFQRAGVR
jgi:hypothetical protein